MNNPTGTQPNALIIFARRPEAGKVKTRLAATIGDAAALDVYIRLLVHTRAVAMHSGVDVHVFLTEMPADLFWQDFTLDLQADGDLGEKMEAAFAQLFAHGYQRVVIIGSDCPELTTAHVREAFSLLETNDVVIGPALDGGYYLLGMKTLQATLFRNKNWSTDTVFTQTIADLEKGGLTYAKLPQLRDIDTGEDLQSVGWL